MLGRKALFDEHLEETFKSLIARPNDVAYLDFDWNFLTDVSGAKVARYVAASDTIQSLWLQGNEFGQATYDAIAQALHVNTSLHAMALENNKAIDQRRCDLLFFSAVHVTHPLGNNVVVIHINRRIPETASRGRRPRRTDDARAACARKKKKIKSF